MMLNVIKNRNVVRKQNNAQKTIQIPNGHPLLHVKPNGFQSVKVSGPSWFDSLRNDGSNVHSTRCHCRRVSLVENDASLTIHRDIRCTENVYVVCQSVDQRASSGLTVQVPQRPASLLCNRTCLCTFERIGILCNPFSMKLDFF